MTALKLPALKSLTSHPLKKWLTNKAKLLTVIVSSLLCFAVIISRTHPFTKGSEVNLDGSWFLAMISLGQQGSWMGRDAYFTYGPLAQLIASGGHLFNTGHSVFDSFGLSLLFFRVIFVVVMAVLLLQIKTLGWRYSLFIFAACLLLGLVVLGTDLNIGYNRTWLILLVGPLLQKALTGQNKRSLIVWSGLTGLIALALQLFTFDLGLYSFFSIILLVVLFMLLARFIPSAASQKLSRRGYLIVLGTVAATYLAGNLLISLLFWLTASPAANYQNLFNYQLQSFEIAGGYNYTMGLDWSPPDLTTWVIFFILLYNIGYTVYYWRKLEYSSGVLLVSFLVLSFVTLKGGLVRSDTGHIVGALIPSLFVFLLLGYDWQGSNRIKVVWVALVVLLLGTWPGIELGTISEVFQPPRSIYADLKENFTHTTPAQDIVESDILTAVDPHKTVTVFPYEDYLATGTDQRMNLPILQTYSAHTLPLQRFYIDTLAKQKNNLEIIWGIDKLASITLDEAQQPARVPLIWEYIYRNFRLKTPQIFGKGYLLLEPTAQPREDMTATSLRFTTNRVSNDNLVFYLLRETQCSMVKVTPKISYPFTSLLGRPQTLKLTLWSKDTPVAATTLVAMQPGQAFSTYIQLFEPQESLNLFGNTPVAQKKWDSLQITVPPSTLFDVKPGDIELNEVACVNFER